MRGLIIAIVLGVAAPGYAQDRDQSLADIRQDLTRLWGEMQVLRQELNTNAASGVTVDGTVLEKVAAIESELQRLTAKTEDLEFRIDRIVRDGTNQISDLEFRLCDLEAACDIATLGDTPTLGGGDAPTAVTLPAPAPAPGPELAVGEEADFNAAQSALDAGDAQTAADGFAAFVVAYPGSPLAPQAEMGRGAALAQLGDTREAARAYLSAFSLDQTGPTAPGALFQLGAALGQLGQVNEACVTLAEVAKRYPAATEAQAQASAEMARLTCP